MVGCFADVGDDAISAEATKDQIRPVAGKDCVIAASGRVQRGGAYQCIAEGAKIGRTGRQHNRGIITHDDIVALTRINRVTRLAADDDIGAVECVDGVTAAYVKERRSERRRCPCNPVSNIRQAAGSQTQADSAVFVEIFKNPTVTKDDIVIRSGVDLVIILAAKDYQRQACTRRGDDIGITHPVVLVVRTLGIQRKEPIGMVQRDNHLIITQASVQRCNRLAADDRTGMGGVDKDVVIAKPGPIGHAAKEISVCVGCISDRRRCKPDHIDISNRVKAAIDTPKRRGRLSCAPVIGDYHWLPCGAITRHSRFVRDHQLLAACARVDVQQSGHVIKVTLQETCIAGKRFTGG